MRTPQRWMLFGLGLALIVRCGGAEAAVIGRILHQGAVDPTTEDAYLSQAGIQPWIEVGAGNGTVGPSNGGWNINTTSTTPGNDHSYRVTPTVADVQSGYALGWNLTTVVELPTIASPNNAKSVSYVSGDGSFGSNSRVWRMDFGTDGSGNAIVQLATPTGSLSYSVGSGGYHQYSLVYDPLTTSASLFVDSSLTPALTGYTGRDVGAVGFASVGFGDQAGSFTGNATYQVVSLVIPEPSCVGAMALASAVLVGGGRRKG